MLALRTQPIARSRCCACSRRGRSNKEIRTALGITVRTTSHHTMHIYDRIGASSRARAALFATEHGLRL